MVKRGTWVPRSTAFLFMELGLGYINLSYGVNLIFSESYRKLVTPATLAAVETIMPLAVYGYLLIAGSLLLVVGILGQWPLYASASHLIMAVIFTAIGVSVLQVAPLNQILLVIGLVLHPTMATALARDVGRAAGERALRK